MDDDGQPLRRWHFVAIGAFILILTLLLIPAHTVSYNKSQAALESAEETANDEKVEPGISRETETIQQVSSQLQPKANYLASSGSNSTAASDETPEMPIYDSETERVLHAIAICESGDRQFDTDGSVLMNRHGSSATGRYQIMSSVWRPTAESMGINIDTAAGNKKMAYHILRETQQGIYAWSESFPCMARHGVVIK